MAYQPQERSDEGTSNATEHKGKGSDHSRSEASSRSCGACKYTRRKCDNECIFAPYFASDQSSVRFSVVHKVFGRSNLSKMLKNVEEVRRHEVIDSLYYEAQARLADPVYGCVSTIAALQQQVASLQGELYRVQDELINTKILNANLLQSTLQQQQQQQPNIDVTMQPEYSYNAPASSNLMNMSSFNAGFDNLAMQTAPPTHSFGFDNLAMQTAPPLHSSEPLQFSGLPQHEEESMIPPDFNNDLPHLFP